jgi:hypothetical protein
METVCPYCDKFLEVPEEIEGTRTRCQFCNEIFTVDPLFVLDTDNIDEYAFAPLKDGLNRRPTLSCG